MSVSVSRAVTLTQRLLVTALMPASTVIAQPERPEPAAITVTGTRQTPEDLRKQAKDFVRQTGIAAGERPLARWIDPICPHAYGIDPAYAEIVEAKIRDVAMQAGARVGKASCRANIAITFSEDGGDLVRTMIAKAPNRFNKAGPQMLDALRNGTDAIRWWYGTEMRDRDGGPAAAAAGPWTTGDAPGGGSAIPMDDDTVSLNLYSMGLISTPVSRALTSATVVIDVKRAEGLPLEAVLSYAALVALAEVKPVKPAPAGSILSLFELGSEARTLTTGDETFLQALYRIPLDRPARQQRKRLASAMFQAARGEATPP